MAHNLENPEASLEAYISKIESGSAKFNDVLLAIAKHRPIIDEVLEKRSSINALLDILKETIPNNYPKSKNKDIQQILKDIQNQKSPTNKNFQHTVELTILVSNIASIEANIARLEKRLSKLNRLSKTSNNGNLKEKESLIKEILRSQERIKEKQAQIEALIPSIDFSNISLETIQKAVTPIWQAIWHLIQANGNGSADLHSQTSIATKPESKQETIIEPKIEVKPDSDSEQKTKQPEEAEKQPTITEIPQVSEQEIKPEPDNGSKPLSFFKTLAMRKRLEENNEKRDKARTEESYKKEVIRNTFIEMLKEEFNISHIAQKVLNESMKGDADIVSRVINYVIEGFDLAKRQSVKDELIRISKEDQDIKSLIEEGYERRFNKILDSFQEMSTHEPQNIEEIDEEVRVIFEYGIEHSGIPKEWLERKRDIIRQKFLDEFLTSKNQLKILRSIIPTQDIEQDLNISENSDKTLEPQNFIEKIQKLINTWNMLNSAKDFKENIGEVKSEKICNTYLIYILSKTFDDLESLYTDYKNTYESIIKANNNYEKLIKTGSYNKLLVKYYIQILTSENIQKTLREIYHDIDLPNRKLNDEFCDKLKVLDIYCKESMPPKEKILEEIRKNYPNIDFKELVRCIKKLPQLLHNIENYDGIFLRYKLIEAILLDLLSNISNENIRKEFEKKIIINNNLFSYKNFRDSLDKDSIDFYRQFEE